MSMMHSHAFIAKPDGVDHVEADDVTIGAGLDFSDPESPFAPYYLQTSHLVAVLLLGAVYLFFTSLALWHTDIWGHLSFGRWIVQYHCLPDHEPFCRFSDPHAESLHSCWLSQTVLYGLYHGGEILAGGGTVSRMEGGVEMLRILHAFLAVLRCGIFLAAFRRLTGSLPFACAGVALLLLLSPGHFSVFRPQMFGEVIFAGILYAVSGPALSRRSLVLVPLSMALWANLHGSFLIGLAFLGACLTGRLIEVARAERSIRPARLLEDSALRRLLAVCALSLVAAALLNPHGVMIYQQALSVGRHPNIATLDEWKPLDFGARWGGHWPYLVSVGLLIVSQLLSPRWYSPTQWLLILGLGLTPCVQQRMMVWWVPIVPWVLLPLWVSTGKLLRWRWLHRESVPSLRKTLLAAMIVGLVLLWSGPVGWLLKGRPRPLERSITAGTPWRLAEQLKGPANAPDPWLPALAQVLDEHYPEGHFTGCIFASESLGDYLIWSLPPEIPVSIYTHAHLFSADYWQASLTVRSAGSGWGEILDRNHCNLIVVESDLHPQLQVALRRDPAWEIILDEKGDLGKRDERCRLLVAVRTEPL